MYLKNKKVRLIWFIVLLFIIWTFFAFNTENADYASYANWYRITSISGLQNRFEIGFSFSMLLATKMGFTFTQFLMLYSAIGLCLVGNFIIKNCDFPCVALLLYFIYPFFYDVVQIRNFMAMAIVLFGTRFLKKFDMKNVILFISIVLLAMSFHITAVFSFSSMLAYFKNYKTVLRLTVILAVCMCGAFIMLPNSLLNLILNFGAETYVESGSTIKKVIGYCAFSLIASLFAYRISKSRNTTLLRLVPIMLLTCVPIAITSQAYRMFRNLSVLLYVVFLNDGIRIEKRKLFLHKEKIIYIMFAILYSIFFFIRQLSPFAPMYSEVTEAILKNNIFWN